MAFRLTEASSSACHAGGRLPLWRSVGGGGLRQSERHQPVRWSSQTLEFILLLRASSAGLLPQGLGREGRGGRTGGVAQEGGDQRPGRPGPVRRWRGRGSRGSVQLRTETHLLTPAVVFLTSVILIRIN